MLSILASLVVWTGPVPQEPAPVNPPIDLLRMRLDRDAARRKADSADAKAIHEQLHASIARGRAEVDAQREKSMRSLAAADEQKIRIAAQFREINQQLEEVERLLAELKRQRQPK